MGNESGVWIMHGIRESSPDCIHSSDELIEYIRKVGFLPLFRNEVSGFSVEEHTSPYYWWTGNEEKDPWEWRRILAESKQVVYGKFFNRKAGFLSLDYLPYFANWRRNGYDFDVLWDDQKASYREKKIMDCFEEKKEIFSYELRNTAGFGKTGEKNFEGTVTSLEMRLYLVNSDFRQRRNKYGFPYGWHIAVYAMPESLWGYDTVTSAYEEEPETSGSRIWDRMRQLYPDASEEQIRQILKF